ncbi:MAG: CRISPR-associated protein Cas6, partial [Thermonemataceae bacterium]|nr:CRISPR-associated protein Cas6 [Thermonemataceae bacterium]
MRVRIVFSLQNKGATAPFHHQDLLYGWLTRLLPEIYTDYQEMYSFSGLKGQIEVSQKGLHF